MLYFVAIVLAVVLTSILGAVIFPPFVICLYLTDGDLNECSWGLWSNWYRSGNYYEDDSYYESYDYNYNYGP